MEEWGGESEPMKRTILKFPLDRSEAVPVSIEDLKVRNSNNIRSSFIIANLDKRSPIEYSDSIRLLNNKWARLDRAWNSNAHKFALCLFCFGQTISYTDKANIYYTYCIKCSNDIWNSICLVCSWPIKKHFYVFCIECFEEIDDRDLKEKFSQFIIDEGIDQVERLSIIRQPRRCSLCEAVVPAGAGIFCPIHTVLDRNFNRYQRQLKLEAKCPFCETQYSDDLDYDRSNGSKCSKCTALHNQAPFEHCLSCKKVPPKFYKGTRLTVRYDVCIECVDRRASIAAGWEDRESAGERAIYRLLCELYGKEGIFRYSRPYWMARLELDFYLPDEKLAFEFDGMQHHTFSPHFHRTEEDFNRQVERDREKELICEANGVRLIRIRFDEPLTLDHLIAKIRS